MSLLQTCNPQLIHACTAHAEDAHYLRVLVGPKAFLLRGLGETEVRKTQCDNVEARAIV